MFKSKMHCKLFFISVLMYISVLLLAGYAISLSVLGVPLGNAFRVLAYLVTYVIIVLSIYFMYVTEATRKHRNYIPYIYLLLLIVYPVAMGQLNFSFPISVHSSLTSVDGVFLWCALFLMFCLALVLSIDEREDTGHRK